MRNIFREYRAMSYEQRTVSITIAGLCFSAVAAVGKLIAGLFVDYDLCGIAVYTFAILIAKSECLLGIKSVKRSFKTRNLLIAVFLFVSSILYSAFMLRLLFVNRTVKEYGIVYVSLLAFVSFAELGFAIAGIFRTKNKGHFYRDIKIINFAIALIAILTTQMTILDFCATADTDIYNCFTGMGVGVIIAACAVYILIAPKVSVIDREHNVFVLKDADGNKLVDTDKPTAEIMLKKSVVYGSYVYRATVRENVVDGNIERDKSLWKRLPLLLKILCCVLSEILIFVWLIGRFVFFLFTLNLPKRLERKMNSNGFVKVQY